MEKSKSAVHVYSIGIVAEDKPRGTDRVKIIPIETNFMQPTAVNATETPVEKQHEAAGATDNLTVKTGNAITAKWWKYNSNRVNSPDVKREDYVRIWRIGETDMYFWEDLNMSNVKRLEDAVYAWSADPTNQMADDLSNAYVLNISPMDGHITLRTSMANGEKNAYLMQLNTRDGMWQLVDDKGRKFYMNSPEDDLGFENAMLSKVNINKEDAFIFTKKSINFETQTINEKCKVRICNASESITNTTQTYLTTAKSKATFDTPKGLFTKDFEVGKDFKYGGIGEGIGTFTVSDAIIAHITFSKHTHTEQGDGNDVSTPH
ncbi:putative structural protein [Salmonella phage SPAsTU]|nr:putative structural protein [Salmonella phage STsAS]AWN09162.1 putative structural protein [Salmonella phage SPAsTU]